MEPPTWWNGRRTVMGVARRSTISLWKALVYVAMLRLRRWPYTFVIGVSILIGSIAVLSAVHLDLPLRDPDGFLGPSYIRLPLLALAFLAAGVFVEALRRSGWRKLPGAMIEVVRSEWSLRRVLHIGTGLASFYVCYVSYRNLKSVLPIYREGIRFDQQLLQLDNWLGGGNDPATLLHHLFGTDFMAQTEEHTSELQSRFDLVCRLLLAKKKK